MKESNISNEEGKQATGCETSLVTSLRLQHNKLVKKYNDLLLINLSAAQLLVVKIETLERQIQQLQKQHQDLLHRQASMKIKKYLL
jgi:hypothetical protein